MVAFVPPDRRHTPGERHTVLQLSTLMILAQTKHPSPQGFRWTQDAPPDWDWPQASKDHKFLS